MVSFTVINMSGRTFQTTLSGHRGLIIQP